MMKYLDIKLRPVQNVQQKCISCRRWFDLGPIITPALVANYALLQQMKPATRLGAPCPHCATQQDVEQIGRHDHPNLERDKCAMTFIQYKATGKTELIDTLNAKRKARNLKPLVSNSLTKQQLEDRIHHIDTMPDHFSAPARADTPEQLLARLNVLRLRINSKLRPLKAWNAKATRHMMLSAIREEEQRLAARAPVTKGRTAIADGAPTTRYRTDMHKNKLIGAVKKLDKREARAKLKAQRALAEDLSARAGFTRANVMRWLQVRNIASLKQVPEDWNPLVRKFVEDRHTALRGERTAPKARTPRAPKDPNIVGSAELAEALKSTQRAVRVILRKQEKHLKPAWRDLKAGRWAFKKQFMSAIVKALGGK